ncbi:hypothetical protein LBMAG51_05890 [Phycisphaerae bacterium]|nr:hypothetical protein LBMAG51_05890 [Phycisphaerae bacterium]
MQKIFNNKKLAKLLASDQRRRRDRTNGRKPIKAMDAGPGTAWNENALVKLASPPAERRSEKRIKARSVTEFPIARLLKLKLPRDIT